MEACAIACHRCNLRLRSEPDNQNPVIFYCYFKTDAPRALVFRPLVKGNEALGTRLQWCTCSLSRSGGTPIYGLSILGGGPRESRILVGYYGFSTNFSFTFQAIWSLCSSHISVFWLCFGPFSKFSGDFRHVQIWR